jgi:glycosyltransferase involved in cell wall biosynthesis
MKKLRIVHLEDRFNPTAGYQLNELLKMDSENIEKILITSYDMTPFHKDYNKEEDKEIEKKYNVKIVRLPVLFNVGTRLWLKGMFKEVKKANPDILFMHGIPDLKDLMLLLPKKKYLIFRDCHMSWVASKNRYAKQFYKFYSMTFAKIINKTNKYAGIYSLGTEETEYLKAIGIRDEKIIMLPHGYDKEQFYYSAEEREKKRKELGLSDDNILISYIGKFDKDKEPDLILDILDKMGINYVTKNKIKILFLGPKNEDYMQSIFTIKFNKSIFKNEIMIFPGKKADELRAYYLATDICIFPKQTTLSSIHAQVCGCKVVMENHKSNKERVIDNRNLYQEGNLEKAAEIIKRIIDSKEYLDKSVSKELEKREYGLQSKNLIYEWERLLKDKSYKKGKK